MAMIIETDFTSQKITLRFESTDKRVELTDEETREFNKRMSQIMNNQD